MYKRQFCQRAGELGLKAVRVMPTPLATGDLSEEEIRLLTAPAEERPTAVASYDEPTAIPVLHGAVRLGLRVPNDLAVIATGMGAVDSATLLRLTFVRTPWSDVAQRAVDVLIDIIEGKEVNLETVLPVKLVVGDTT